MIGEQIVMMMMMNVMNAVMMMVVVVTVTQLVGGGHGLEMSKQDALGGRRTASPDSLSARLLLLVIVRSSVSA